MRKKRNKPTRNRQIRLTILQGSNRICDQSSNRFHPRKASYLIRARPRTPDEQQRQQDREDKDDDEAERNHDSCTMLWPGPPQTHLVAVWSPSPLIFRLLRLFVVPSRNLGPVLYAMILLDLVVLRHPVSCTSATSFRSRLVVLPQTKSTTGSLSEGATQHRSTIPIFKRCELNMVQVVTTQQILRPV